MAAPIGVYQFEFRGGPWQGESVTLLRHYLAINLPESGGKYTWCLEKECYLWEPADGLEEMRF